MVHTTDEPWPCLDRGILKFRVTKAMGVYSYPKKKSKMSDRDRVENELKTNLKQKNELKTKNEFKTKERI